MEKGGRKVVKSPTKSSPARSISSVSSKNSKNVGKKSPSNDNGKKQASSNDYSNMTKPLPLPDFEIHHDNGVKSNITIKDAYSDDEYTHNIHKEDHGIEIAAVVKGEEKASRKHTKSGSVFQRLAETPIHHLSHQQTEVKSSPTKTSSTLKTTSSSPTKKSSSSPTKKSSKSPTKSSPARSISSVSSKNSKNVGKKSPSNDNGKKQASSNDYSNMTKPLPLPDLAAELDDNIKANENEDSDNQNDADFSIYFDNIPIEDHGIENEIVAVVKEDEKASSNSTPTSLDVNTSIQMNLNKNKNNSDVVDKHTKSVFQRLADTPIHHLSAEAKSPTQKQFSDDQHQHHHHHHHIHPTYDNHDNHDNHVESVFERLSQTPIHHLTDREKLDIQQSNPVLQSKSSSHPTKRVTHSNLHVNRVQGLTPEVKNIAGSKVIHAVVLLTTVPPLVDVHQETTLSEEIDYNLIALALLQDRIHTISKLKGHSGNKLIVAIPDDADQKNGMNNILEKMNLKEHWSILTIPNDVPKLKDTTSGNLSELLKYTLKILGPFLKKGSISYTSSDCPTLHYSEIVCAQSVASEDSNFYICPAQDGGYCLLTVPAATPPEIFDNIEWSNNDTCIQQILALRKVATESPQKKKQIVIVGKTHRDIDNTQDLKYLKELINNNKDKEFEKDFPKTIGVLNRLILN